MFCDHVMVLCSGFCITYFLVNILHVAGQLKYSYLSKDIIFIYIIYISPLEADIEEPSHLDCLKVIKESPFGTKR